VADNHADLSTEVLAREYGKRVYNVAYRITGNHQDAEDVTQETFLQVHRNLPRFRGASSAFTWIYRIAVNTSLQYQRRADRAMIDGLDALILEFRDDIPDDVRHWQSDPESRHIYNELLSEVQEACCHFITFRLTDEQRVVYVLRVILGFSLDEISGILEVNKNTVKARLQRAKESLHNYFSGRCQWVEGGGDCSCESRLGFALTAAPEIIKRLRDTLPSGRTKKLVRQTLDQVKSIDEIYSRLPEVDHRSVVLARFINPKE